MTSLILTRMGLNKEWDNQSNSPLFKRKEIEEKNEYSSFFYKRKEREKNKPTVNFFTNIGALTQLETILQTREFHYEISSPRYPVEIYDETQQRIMRNADKNQHKKRIHIKISSEDKSVYTYMEIPNFILYS